MVLVSTVSYEMPPDEPIFPCKEEFRREASFFRLRPHRIISYLGRNIRENSRAEVRQKLHVAINTEGGHVTFPMGPRDRFIGGLVKFMVLGI